MIDVNDCSPSPSNAAGSRSLLSRIGLWVLVIIFMLGVGTILGVIVMGNSVSGSKATANAFTLSSAEPAPEQIADAASDASADEREADESGVEPAAVRIPAFEPFSLPTIDETRVRFPDDFGAVTVLLAATPGCPSCAIEGSSLSQLMTEYEEAGLRVIVVDILPGSSPEFLQLWADMTGTNNLTWALDEGRAFGETFNIQRLDTTVVYDASGRQVFRDEWVTDEETLRAMVERAFANNNA